MSVTLDNLTSKSGHYGCVVTLPQGPMLPSALNQGQLQFGSALFPVYSLNGDFQKEVLQILKKLGHLDPYSRRSALSAIVQQLPARRWAQPVQLTTSNLDGIMMRAGLDSTSESTRRYFRLCSDFDRCNFELQLTERDVGILREEIESLKNRLNTLMALPADDRPFDPDLNNTEDAAHRDIKNALTDPNHLDHGLALNSLISILKHEPDTVSDSTHNRLKIDIYDADLPQNFLVKIPDLPFELLSPGAQIFKLTIRIAAQENEAASLQERIAQLNKQRESLQTEIDLLDANN